MTRYRVPVTATYDIGADASYIYLTEEQPASRRDRGKWGGLSPDRDVETVAVDGLPDSVQGDVLLDFRQGRLIGIEVLGPARVLPEDFMALLR